MFIYIPHAVALVLVIAECAHLPAIISSVPFDLIRYLSVYFFDMLLASHVNMNAYKSLGNWKIGNLKAKHSLKPV